MNIELRNIKEHRKISRETVAYSAELFINGIFICDVTNNGNGGMTNIIPLGKDNQKAVQEANDYLKAQANGKRPLDGYLEEYVDNLVYKFLNKKDIAKMQKNKLVIVCPDNGIKTLKLNYPVAVYLMNETGRNSLKNTIENILTRLLPGEKIVNTNLGILTHLIQ